MALVGSILTGGSNNHETTSEEVNAWSTDFVDEGIVGAVSNTSGVAPMTGGFAVNAQGTPDMTIAVSTGVAYIEVTPSTQGTQTLRAYNNSSSNVTVSANSSGSTKYDWLYIAADATNANDPNTAGDNIFSLTTSRSSSSTSDDGTPPTYGYAIAIITVANGASSITNGNIRDVRQQTYPAAAAISANAGWQSLGSTPSSITSSGNRIYDLTFTGVDLSSDVSPGMRLRTTRTIAAPTQCTDLEASSTQYWSKSSPSGITFTDDFVVSAWIKLESYPALGNFTSLVAKTDGTGGWLLYITDAGQVTLQGNNGGFANYSKVASYQSLPLNKWVHIAAQLDMSAFTATSTTSYIMIDGVDVPAVVSRGGTNPTSLTSAGNLNIGAYNGGTSPYDGKIAQVAIYSAKVTQANIRATISQGLSGTETNLASAYSFNGTANDLNTTNANNLTAQNSATSATADSPFGGQAGGSISSTLDYAEIQAVAFSTNTTVTVRTTPGNTIPTTGGVSSIDYSSSQWPYGYPGGTEILGQSLMQAAYTTAGASLEDIKPLQTSVYVPAGKSVEIEVFIAQVWSSVDSVRVDTRLYEDSTYLTTNYNRSWTAANGGNGGVMLKYIATPTAGNHTYKVSMITSSGTIQAYAGVDARGYIKVKVDQ